MLFSFMCSTITVATIYGKKLLCPILGMLNTSANGDSLSTYKIIKTLLLCKCGVRTHKVCHMSRLEGPQ